MKGHRKQFQVFVKDYCHVSSGYMGLKGNVILYVQCSWLMLAVHELVESLKHIIRLTRISSIMSELSEGKLQRVSIATFFLKISITLITSLISLFNYISKHNNSKIIKLLLATLMFYCYGNIFFIVQEAVDIVS